LTTVLVASLSRAFPLISFDDLTGTVPTFREYVSSLMVTYGRASAGVASNFYKDARAEAGVTGRFNPDPVVDVPEGFMDAAIAETMSRLDAEFERAFASKAEQLVLDRGREQLLFATRTDDKAKGWARVTHDGACSFCLMLALRAGAGYLYDSKRSANFRAHSVQPNGSGGDCRCSVEPVFTLPYEPSAQVRQAQGVWESVEKDEDGNVRTGHDLRTAFRQAIEGRTVTGAKKDEKGKPVKRHKAAEGKTPENQRFQLELLQAMPPATTSAAAQWRVQRIAEIRKYLGE
jgi:hypothetical protein